MHTEILFSFHLFPSKGKRGAYPFCFLTTSSLKFLAYYTALTYQKQDAFLYCQPFHLKCKLILTQCALTKIKVGTLTFLGHPPPQHTSPYPLPGASHWRTREGAKRERREEGRGRRFGIVTPSSPKGCPHLTHGASQSPAHLVSTSSIKALVNNAAEWVNTVLVRGKPLCHRRRSLQRDSVCVWPPGFRLWGWWWVGRRGGGEAEPDISGASAPRRSTPAHSHCVFSAAYSL